MINSNILLVKFFVFLVKTIFLVGFYSSVYATPEVISDRDFDEALKAYSVDYEIYDSPEHKVADFFGIKTTPSLDKQVNYQDLKLTVDSSNIRELYFQKINEMTTRKEIFDKERGNSFFDGKL